MTPEQKFQLLMALIATVPPTLTGIATILYVIRNRKSIESKMELGHQELNSKVDAVKTEVDGKTFMMINTIKEMAEKVVDKAHEPRLGRKTDKAEGEQEG